MQFILGAIAILIVIAAALAGRPIEKPPGEPAVLARVIDGDTLVLAGGERVRLAAIDAPEIGEEGAIEATRALEALLDGAALRIERLGTDRYGRTLAAVYADGVDVSGELFRMRLVRQWID